MIKTAIHSNSKTVIITNSKRSIKPWITAGSLRCIRVRNAIYLKLKSDPHNQILAITYKRYRTFCGNLITKLKNNYNKDKIKTSAKNPRALWSTINDITNYKPPRYSNSDLLKVKTCPKDAVNHVNNYFINIGQTLARTFWIIEYPLHRVALTVLICPLLFF